MKRFSKINDRTAMQNVSDDKQNFVKFSRVIKYSSNKIIKEHVYVFFLNITMNKIFVNNLQY